MYANRRRIISGVCLIGLALYFATHSLMGLNIRHDGASTLKIALYGFIAPVHMLLMIASILGIMQLLRRRADRTALVGGAFALMGWAVGIRIMVLGQLSALLESGVTGVPANALNNMFERAPIVWTSIVPVGLMFPLGLIILGLTLVAVHPIHRGIGALLAIGGVLFPIGRAARIEWAVTSCDLVLGATFALIGWQILTRPELWSAEEARVQHPREPFPETARIAV